MTILKAGTFNVSRCRIPIPERIKRQKILDRIKADIEAGKPVNWDADAYQIDHRPPLVNRDFDTEAALRRGEFIPPQNDPDYIFAMLKSEHQQLTTGRAPGAERTVTTRGSDVGEAKRSRDIQAKDALHRARMAAKAGDTKAINEILASARPKRRNKGSIPSRPFEKRRDSKTKGIASRPFSRHSNT